MTFYIRLPSLKSMRFPVTGCTIMVMITAYKSCLIGTIFYQCWIPYLCLQQIPMIPRSMLENKVGASGLMLQTPFGHGFGNDFSPLTTLTSTTSKFICPQSRYSEAMKDPSHAQHRLIESILRSIQIR
jgi:hypothetical protein